MESQQELRLPVAHVAAWNFSVAVFSDLRSFISTFI
jgi:hypothetical protein